MNYSSINGFSALLSMYFKCALIVSLMIIRICLNGSNDALTWGSDQGSVSVPDQDDDGDQGEDDAEAGDADGKDCKHWPMPHILNLEKKNIECLCQILILVEIVHLVTSHITHSSSQMTRYSTQHTSVRQETLDWNQCHAVIRPGSNNTETGINLSLTSTPDHTRLGYLWIINLL